MQSESRPESSTSELRVSRVLLIANPAARRTARDCGRIERALASREIDCEAVWTSAPGHATEIARAACDRRYGALFALGGDGTAMEAVSGVALNPMAPPIGILPGGTANIFARTLGIPLEPVRAATTLLDGTSTTLDLGRLSDGRRFLIGAGIGLDAAMIAGASSSLKARLGWGAYIIGAALAGLKLERFPATITVDGETHRVRAASILVANVGTAAKRFHFGTAITPNDGALNVCVYAPKSRIDAARLFWRMLRGRLDCDRCFFTVSGRHITIETDTARAAQADGELLSGTPLEITVEPAATRVLVPTPARRAA